MSTEYPEDDQHYEEHRIESVTKHPSGAWSIGYDKCMGFTVPKESPVAPKVGALARLYGKGFGYRVRGLFIDGTKAYYRTEEEDDQHQLDQLYPQTVEEALARWDSGDSIFTVSMGGLGPGYEQCIHILCFELIRQFKDAPREFFDDSEEMLHKLGGMMDEFSWADEGLKRLGLSGAQAGAGKQLAYRAIRDGWQKMVLGAKEQDADRLIQVSKEWPSLEPPSAA